MRQSSDFDDAILDDLRQADAYATRRQRARLFRLFDNDEPFSEPDDDTQVTEEDEA